MGIDYDLAKREGPRFKAQLTRALRVADPEKRREAVTKACVDALSAWQRWGAWPDYWSRWQRALSDQYPVFQSPLLEDLAGALERP